MNIVRNTFFSTLVVLTAAMIGWTATPSDAHAEEYTGVSVRIETSKKTIYNDQVYITDEGCTVKDSTGASHQIAGDVALCALQLASTQGDFTYELINSSFGLYLNAVDGVSSTSSQFWLYYVNDTSAMVGLSEYDLSEGDELLFTFGEYPSSPLRLNVKKKQATTKREVVATVKTLDEFGTGSYVPVVGATVHFGKNKVVTNSKGVARFVFQTKGEYSVFATAEGYTKTATTNVIVHGRNSGIQPLSADEREQFVDAGWNYVMSEMNEEGFGSASLNDWAVMAMTAAQQRDEAVVALISAYDPKSSDGASAADLARHVMAIKAIGEDPHSFNGVNYVERLKGTMQKNQFGDQQYVNDDIFAVLALNAAGETARSQEVKKAVKHILKSLNADGGVSFAIDAEISEVDTTAAWLQSLSTLKYYPELGPEVLKARKKAVRYLKQQQNPDGGWGYADHGVSNAPSTSWALQGLISSQQHPKRTRKNHRNGFDFLINRQAEGGQVVYDVANSPSNEILNTIYAIMPMAGRSLPI